MLGKRFHLMTLAGFKIGIDASWFFIAVLVSWTLADGYFPYYYPKLSPEGYWAMGILGMLGLFVCVVLHELGHALVARHYKLPISQITLFIFGGIAEIKKEPESPKVEFLMALAGPAVSLFLSFCFYLTVSIGGQLFWPIGVVAVFRYLATINLVLVLFNMIPAFPLDGGRVFRALLWGWTKNFALATKVAAGMGTVFGFLLIFWGILSCIMGNFVSGIWLAVIGLFLQRAASSSKSHFHMGRYLEKEKVLAFMTTDPICAPSSLTVKAFVEEYVYKSRHHVYPVVEGNAFVGYCGLVEIKTVRHEEWDRVVLKEIMVSCSEFETVSPETNAAEALRLMQQESSATLFVVKEGRPVGILTAQDLCKLISLKLALEGGQPR